MASGSGSSLPSCYDVEMFERDLVVDVSCDSPVSIGKSVAPSSIFLGAPTTAIPGIYTSALSPSPVPFSKKTVGKRSPERGQKLKVLFSTKPEVFERKKVKVEGVDRNNTGNEAQEVPSLGKRNISIAEVNLHVRNVCFEGKVLAKYGLFLLQPSKLPRHLKFDLTDRFSDGTSTFHIDECHFNDYEETIGVGDCIRVTSFGVTYKNMRSNGGTCAFTLKHDPRTSMHKIEVFEADPIFFPETSLSDF